MMETINEGEDEMDLEALNKKDEEKAEENSACPFNDEKSKKNNNGHNDESQNKKVDCNNYIIRKIVINGNQKIEENQSLKDENKKQPESERINIINEADKDKNN